MFPIPINIWNSLEQKRPGWVLTGPGPKGTSNKIKARRSSLFIFLFGSFEHLNGIANYIITIKNVKEILSLILT